jgi:hypothetical protein
MGSHFPLIFPVFVILAIVGIAWHFGRSQSLLDKWAAANGYRIIRREYRNFFRGPFFWTSAKGQTVYYVIVEDQVGRTRNGWVRCGGWWMGLLSDHVEVRWDEPPRPPITKDADPMRDRWLDG